MKNILGSKKFRAFIIGVVGLFLTQIVGLDEGTAEELMKAIISLTGIYMLGEGGVDIVRSLKQPPIVDAPKTDDK